MAVSDAVAPLILIAEDDEDSRALYALFLSSLGYRTAEATDGQEAIDLTRSLAPAAVLMDISLPLVDGLEVTRILRADPQTHDVCILALSGHVDQAHRRKATEVGVDGFLAKPCLPEAVAAQLEGLLDASRRHVASLALDATVAPSDGGAASAPGRARRGSTPRFVA